MSSDKDYCQEPERCQLGFSLNYIAESLNKNNELFAKRLERLEENIIAIREDISAFRSYQESMAEVKQAITRVHERMDDMPKLVDDKIGGLNLDEKFRDINEKLENKISYKQVTFIIAVVSVLFTILNFAINQVR